MKRTTARRVRGANLVEFLILVGAIALVALAAVAAFGKQVAAKLRGEGEAVARISDGGGGGTPSGPLPGVGGPASGGAPTPSPAAPSQGWASRAGEAAWNGAAAVGNGAVSLGKGFFVDGLGGTISSTWELGKGLVTEPGKTLGGIKDGVVAIATDPGGALTAAGAEISRQWKEDPMRLVGNGIFQVLPAARVGTLGKVTKATEVAAEVRTGSRLVANAGETTAGAAARESGFLGEGAFSRAFKDGDHVRKEVKPTVNVDGKQVTLNAAQREELANITADFTNMAAKELPPGIVPPVEVVGPGVLRQPMVKGNTLEQLGPMERIRAGDQMQEYMATIENRIGHQQSPDGWRVFPDRNTANFRFDKDGNVTSWFDPMGVHPPH